MPPKQRKNLAEVRKPQGFTSETTPTYLIDANTSIMHQGIANVEDGPHLLPSINL